MRLKIKIKNAEQKQIHEYFQTRITLVAFNGLKNKTENRTQDIYS